MGDKVGSINWLASKVVDAVEGVADSKAGKLAQFIISKPAHAAPAEAPKAAANPAPAMNADAEQNTQCKAALTRAVAVAKDAGLTNIRDIQIDASASLANAGLSCEVKVPNVQAAARGDTQVASR